MISMRETSRPAAVGLERLGVAEANQVRGGGGPRPPVLDIPIWIGLPVPPIVLVSPLPLP